jgi:hypothetical protein
MSSRIRTYSELQRFETLEERFKYLQLGGQVGYATFGFERWMNQKFYTSRQWRSVRQQVIARDYGRDLAVEGWDIHDRVYIHHMNPMTPEDIKRGLGHILDPEFLITTTQRTHNAIHYGDAKLLPRPRKERTAGDTKLW